MGTTIKQAQAAIDKAGIPVEIVRGEGYHYFIYDVPGKPWETQSVYVCHTNTYSPQEWANQAGIALTAILDRIARWEGK